MYISADKKKVAVNYKKKRGCYIVIDSAMAVPQNSM
jgi:hypothetical protein